MPVVAVDNFALRRDQLANPLEHSFAITPSDTDELAFVTRAISFKTAGALKVVTAGGETVTFPSGHFSPGLLHWVRWKKVFQTDSGAGMDLFGHY